MVNDFGEGVMNKMITVIFLSGVTFLACKDEGSDDTKPPLCPGNDTTSHNFVWDPPVLLGDGGGSILRDVAIAGTDPPLVYAVGEIHLRDSVGNWDQHPFNLAKWDGQRWQFVRIEFNTICGQPGSTTPYPASAILTFGENDVWIAMDGDQVARWNGETESTITCLPVSFSIKKLWGDSPNSVYAVGDGGNIVHYGNGIWQRLESGTILPIRDIWGASNLPQGEPTILAIASGFSPAEGKKLLSIRGTTVTALADEGLSWSLGGLWFVPGCKYFAVGAGIYYKNSLLDAAWSGYPSGVVTSYASEGIRGNNSNDVFVVGSFLEVVHFNGSTWHNYRNEIPFAEGALGRVAVKGNLVIAVGLMGQQAVALVGRR